MLSVHRMCPLWSSFGCRTRGVLEQLFAVHTPRRHFSLSSSPSPATLVIFPSFLDWHNCIQCIWNCSPCDAVAMWRNRFRFRKQSSCCSCSRWDAALIQFSASGHVLWKCVSPFFPRSHSCLADCAYFTYGNRDTESEWNIVVAI